MLIEEQRTNVFLNSTAPATQSFTTTASPYTISFYGSGSITLSGSYVAVVTGSNALIRTTLTFTPTALPLVMTVAGTITKPQLELGSFATSYIETAGSQVTRNGDQASITGTNFSSWYNQSQGCLIADADVGAGFFPTAVSLDDGGYTNRIQFQRSLLASDLNTALSCVYGTVTTFTAASTKFGVSYAQNLVYVDSNTTTVATTTDSLRTGINNMGIGWMRGQGLYCNGHIRSIRYYSTALPSATLQALTS